VVSVEQLSLGIGGLVGGDQGAEALQPALSRPDLRQPDTRTRGWPPRASAEDGVWRGGSLPPLVTPTSPPMPRESCSTDTTDNPSPLPSHFSLLTSHRISIT